MSALLTFIICIFLAIIIVIAVAALSFYRQLRNAARRFRSGKRAGTEPEGV